MFFLPKQIKWEFMLCFFSVLYMYSDVLQSYYFFASYINSATLIHPIIFPTFRVMFEKESHTMNTYHVYTCTCICCEYPGRSGRGYLYDKGYISQINLSRMGVCKEC
jgi:hypothetical protein